MDELYAFFETVAGAHRVARHIHLRSRPSVDVGFNESKFGEGYVVVPRSFDITEVALEATGRYPLRVLTIGEVLAAPDMGCSG